MRWSWREAGSAVHHEAWYAPQMSPVRRRQMDRTVVRGRYPPGSQRGHVRQRGMAVRVGQRAAHERIATAGENAVEINTWVRTDQAPRAQRLIQNRVVDVSQYIRSA